MSIRPFTFLEGTHRLCPPEETLAKISPHLQSCGISRVADLTRLDEIDAPVWAAIRPRGKVLSVSNGKGATPASAKISAIMEAVELHFAENPAPDALQKVSRRYLVAQGATVLHPDLFDARKQNHFSDDFQIQWTNGECLHSGARVAAPASAVYFCVSPSLHDTSSNGLASGNHTDEATLHALYELIERDAVSRLSDAGKIRVRERCAILDPTEIPHDGLRALVASIQSAGSNLRLMLVPTAVGIPVFWAVLLNPVALGASSALNVGFGAHMDPLVAASRAITEAVQSRVTFISAAREDLLTKFALFAADSAKHPAFQFFNKLEQTANWETATRAFENSPTEMGPALDAVLAKLVAAGHPNAWRFTLSPPGFTVAVVRVTIPTLIFNRRVF